MCNFLGYDVSLNIYSCSSPICDWTNSNENEEIITTKLPYDFFK